MHGPHNLVAMPRQESSCLWEKPVQGVAAHMRRLSSHSSSYFKKSQKTSRCSRMLRLFSARKLANAGVLTEKRMSNMPLGGRCHKNHVQAG
jgi:hypothetical protein